MRINRCLRTRQEVFASECMSFLPPSPPASQPVATPCGLPTHGWAAPASTESNSDCDACPRVGMSVTRAGTCPISRPVQFPCRHHVAAERVCTSAEPTRRCTARPARLPRCKRRLLRQSQRRGVLGSHLRVAPDWQGISPDSIPPDWPDHSQSPLQLWGLYLVTLIRASPVSFGSRSQSLARGGRTSPDYRKVLNRERG